MSDYSASCCSFLWKEVIFYKNGVIFSLKTLADSEFEKYTKADELLIIDSNNRSDLQKSKDEIKKTDILNNALILTYKTTITTDSNNQLIKHLSK